MIMISRIADVDHRKGIINDWGRDRKSFVRFIKPKSSTAKGEINASVDACGRASKWSHALELISGMKPNTIESDVIPSNITALSAVWRRTVIVSRIADADHR